MAYLAKADLKTHIYIAIITEIDRGDTTIIPLQIDAAISEAKSYCSRFDLVKLFDPAATGFVDDKNLLDKVKDLACWKIIKLANPNVNMELFRTNYEDAISWFEKVQSGKADPGWPVPADDVDSDIKEGSQVQMQSNTKRENHYR